MKRGYNIIAAIFILLAMTALIFTLVSFVSSDARLAIKNASSQRAFYIASSGLETYLRALREETDWSSPPPALAGAFAGGSFFVSTTDEAKNSITVTSTGTFTREGRSYVRSIRIKARTGGLQALASEYIVYWTGGGDPARETKLDNNVFLGGSVLVNSRLRLGLNDTISGDAYAAGSITGFTGGITGTIEAYYDMPELFPTLETSGFDGQLALAAAHPAGDLTYTGDRTVSGTTYVNGDIRIANEANITVTGSATLVATGKFVVENSATVGDRLTVVSGQRIEVKNNLTVGAIGVWYSATGLTAGNNVVIGGTGENEGSRFITPGDISIGNNCVIDGLFYAGGRVEIGNNLVYRGMILTGYLAGAGENTTCRLAPAALDWDKIGEIVYDGAGGLNIVSWDELY